MWLLYDPSVSDAVQLSISADKEKIKSGEYVTYTVDYGNFSEVELEELTLTVVFPKGFLFDGSEQDRAMQTHISSLTVGETGDVAFSGWFYDVPDQENSIRAMLNYKQVGRNVSEQKIVRLFSNLRGSVIEPALVGPERILDISDFTTEFTLNNTGGQALDVQVPLTVPAGFAPTARSVSLGEIRDDIWYIEQFEPQAQAILRVSLQGDGSSIQEKVTITYTPEIKILDSTIAQAPVEKHIEVFHPEVAIESGWDEQVAEPGKFATLRLFVKNQGDIALVEPLLTLLLNPNVVDIAKARRQLLGNIQGNRLTVTSSHSAKLAQIDPGGAAELVFVLPLRDIFVGKQSELALDGNVSASLLELEEDVIEQYKTAALVLPTNLILSAESRYFTAEGDQLGRGPLPPQVGKQTKYWAIMRIQNTSGIAEDVAFSAKLPVWIEWTGRTSVSLADNLQYDSGSRTINWGIRQMSAQTTAGVFVELGFTPTASHIGQTPALLTNIIVSGVDKVTGEVIDDNVDSIDISIEGDSIGSKRGTAVIAE